jgi:hypothetical protein
MVYSRLSCGKILHLGVIEMVMATISRADFNTAKPGLYRLDEPPVFHEKLFDGLTGEFVSGWYSKMIRIREGLGEPLPESLGLETHVTPAGNLVIVQEVRD